MPPTPTFSADSRLPTHGERDAMKRVAELESLHPNGNGGLTSNPDSDSHLQKKQKLDQDTALSLPVKTREEKRKEKKERKVLAKVEANPPKFFYSATELVRRKEPVGFEDIRDLVLHLTTSSPPVSWLKVQNPSSIPLVLVLHIPGLTPSLLSLPPPNPQQPNMPISVPAKVPALPFLERFMHALPTKAPGDKTRMHSVMSAFVTCPVTGEEKKRRIKERIDKERETTYKPEMYVLSTEEMVENGYPMPSYMSPEEDGDSGLPPGWVETPSPPTSTEEKKKPPKIYAIDCEMCIVSSGEKALTHIAILLYSSNKNKNTYYTTLHNIYVRPALPITDYLTQYSGVTPSSLEGVTTTLEDVQRLLLGLLSPSEEEETPILLGHSLYSDLTALRLRHGRVIDTSVMYHHPRGAPYKPALRWLVGRWCEREIQAGKGGVGHDPEEDAGGCCELLWRKVENGPGYGEFKTDTETIFERIKGKSVVVDHGNPEQWYGKKASLCVGVPSEEGDVGIVKALKGVLEEGGGGGGMVFGKMSALAGGLGWITSKVLSGSETTPTLPDPPPDPLSLLSSLSLSTHLQNLYVSLPPRAAMLIFTGHADPRAMAELNRRRSEFEGQHRDKRGGEKEGAKEKEKGKEEVRWTMEDGRRLEEETAKAKMGLLFVCIKK